MKFASCFKMVKEISLLGFVLILIASSYVVCNEQMVKNESNVLSESGENAIQLPSPTGPESAQTVKNSEVMASPVSAWDRVMQNSNWIRSGLTGSIMQNVLQNIENTTDITDHCKNSMLAYRKDLEDWIPWAIKMADSSAKPPAGFLDGNLVDFGAFEQCLAVRSDLFQGKYCLVGHYTPLLSSAVRERLHGYIERFGQPPEWMKYYLTQKCNLSMNVSLWMGVCMPSTCTDEDIRKLFLTVSEPYDMDVKTSDCQVDEKRSLSSNGSLALKIILAILCLSALGTVLDVYIFPIPENKKFSEDEGIAVRVLRVFSVRRCVRNLAKENSKRTPLDCLHGMRLYSCTVMILGHVYMYPEHWHYTRFSHLVRADDLVTDIDRPIYENGAILLSNFFFSSGILLVYSTWEKLEKNGGRIHIIKFILRKYLRILPSFFLTVGLLFIMPSLSRAPTWKSTWQQMTEACENNIWKNLLSVSNFWMFEDQCLLHTWFLSALMQCQIIGLLLLLFTFRWRKAGVVLAVLMISICCMDRFRLSTKHKFMPVSPFIINDAEETTFNAIVMYFSTIMNIPLYLIGMLAGYILLKTANTSLDKKYRVIGWSITFPALLLMFFGMRLVEPQGVLVHYYNTFHRIIWCLGMTWVVYACSTGKGGLINTLLTWRPLVYLSNLSFLTYLIHPLLYLYKAASLKERLYYGHVEHIYDFVAIWTLSYILSYFFHILVEAPFGEIECMLIGNEFEGLNPISDGATLSRPSEKTETSKKTS